MSDNINLKTIDWNNLSIENFSNLSERLNDNLAKKSRKKSQIDKNKFIVINIDDSTYEISYSDYVRYKTLKSKKSKENFHKYVLKNYPPITEL